MHKISGKITHSGPYPFPHRCVLPATFLLLLVPTISRVASRARPTRRSHAFPALRCSNRCISYPACTPQNRSASRMFACCARNAARGIVPVRFTVYPRQPPSSNRGRTCTCVLISCANSCVKSATPARRSLHICTFGCALQTEHAVSSGKSVYSRIHSRADTSVPSCLCSMDHGALLRSWQRATSNFGRRRNDLIIYPNVIGSLSYP